MSAASQRAIVLAAGPGGVGKTTCAAAMALALADAGAKVVVVTIDPSRRLAQALGLADDAPAAGGQPARVWTSPDGRAHLDALLLDTTAVFDDIVRGCASSPAAAAAIVEHPIYQATVTRLGGALEYAATARLQMLHASGAYDVVVLDTPPTANAMDFLEAPSRVNEVIDNPAAKLLTGTGGIGGRLLGLGTGVLLRVLERVGGGGFIRSLGVFLREFGSVLEEFRRRSGDFEQLLRSPAAGVVLVTAATTFTVREAKGFAQTLRAHGLRIDRVVLNRVDPPLPPWPGEAVFGALEPAADPAAAPAPALALDPTARERLRAAYAAAEAHGARGAAARDELVRAEPGLAVVTIPRADPPPTTLDELLALGRTILAAPSP
jgi:anion-transporting  ArsA/GET3 family ATPase